MKNHKWIYAVNAVAFLIIIIYFGVLSLMLPTPTESEVERRELAAKPDFSFASYFAKEYTRSFDTFYADTFPARESFIQLSYALDSFKGVEGEVKFYQSNIQEEQKPLVTSSSLSSSSSSSESASLPASSSSSESSSQPASSETSSESASTLPPQTNAVDDNAYLNNNIFIYKGAAYQIFYGDNAAAERFANIVSSYAAELPGVNVYAQVVPQPFNFYLPEKYRKMGRNEQDYAALYQSKLTSGAKGVKVYEKLEENKDEYIYFRSDTHWTARGAYSAYLAFCESAGFAPVSLDSMERRVVPGDFYGYLYTITMDNNLIKNPDYVEYFIVPGVTKVEAFFDRGGASKLQTMPSLWAEDRRGGAAYSTFIYGDLPYMKVSTSAGTGRSVLLIKDSYGNAFAPFLASHYDTVHILDERYYPYSVYGLIEQQGIDDVIISQSSYSANSGSHQQNLVSLKKGHSGKQPPDYSLPPPEPAPAPTPAPAPEPEPEPEASSAAEESSSSAAE